MHKLPPVAAASARAFTCATPDFQALPPMLQEKQPSLYLYIISCTSSRDDPDYTFSIHLLEPALSSRVYNMRLKHFSLAGPPQN